MFDVTIDDLEEEFDSRRTIRIEHNSERMLASLTLADALVRGLLKHYYLSGHLEDLVNAYTLMRFGA